MTSQLPSHEFLQARGGSTPTRWVLFVHGILGRGSNWRGFARRLLAELPSFGAILVDLRAHGDSRDLPPPDSVDSAAADLARLVDHLGDKPIHAVVGHSFGGKVSLALAQLRSVEHVVLVDSMPGARTDGGDAVRVVRMLRTLPARFGDRRAFEAYVGEFGLSPAITAWLGQNLDRLDDGGYEFALDIERIQTLLDDYLRRDDWALLDPPPRGTRVHVVIGGRSAAFDDADRARALELQARIPPTDGSVRVSVLEGAGHWVHIDDPDGLRSVLVEALA